MARKTLRSILFFTKTISKMIEKNDKIADLLTKYPFLKEKLIERNPVFKKLNNPVVFNSVGKFARIQEGTQRT